MEQLDVDGGAILAKSNEHAKAILDSIDEKDPDNRLSECMSIIDPVPG